MKVSSNTVFINFCDKTIFSINPHLVKVTLLVKQKEADKK